MTPRGAYRAVQAAERRFQREAQRRRRELERQAKEMAKLSALEQARLEVATYENQLDVLLSVHKEPCEPWDWVGLASALRPHTPRRESLNEQFARQLALVAHPLNREAACSNIERGRALDQQLYEEALKSHEDEVTNVEKLRKLAVRILDGEGMAFLEAFAELNPVAEFSSVGSLKQFAVENRHLINCVFKVNAKEVIPKEVKSLTSSGKLSAKPIPKGRFHEIYEEYVYACACRMAREVFAMLPIDTLLVTTLADVDDPNTGRTSELPVLSVAFVRSKLAEVDFEKVTPAEAVGLFIHRCNSKVTRKAGVFQPIAPLEPSDLRPDERRTASYAELLGRVQELRGEIGPARGTGTTGSRESQAKGVTA